MKEFTPSYLKEQAAHPEWEKARKVHDWRNYISEELRDMWNTFTLEQRLAIASNADEQAGREEWD